MLIMESTNKSFRFHNKEKMNTSCIPILGVQINATNMDLALKQIETWLSERSSNYICVAPAHSIMECVNDPTLLPIFNDAGMVTPDGMAVVWLLKFKGHKHVGRVYGPDLLHAACAHGLSKGYRHYFYGGAPGVAEKLVEKLSEHFPGLQVAGMLAPPFRSLSPEEDQEIIRQINAARADIIWVGLGSPKQEIWMHSHLGKVNAPLMVGVGAAFDFLSGKKTQAPLWIQRHGLEWLFRFASEPVRLWPRYRQYPKFILLVMAEGLGLLK